MTDEQWGGVREKWVAIFGECLRWVFSDDFFEFYEATNERYKNEMLLRLIKSDENSYLNALAMDHPGCTNQLQSILNPNGCATYNAFVILVGAFLLKNIIFDHPNHREVKQRFAEPALGARRVPLAKKI